MRTDWKSADPDYQPLSKEQLHLFRQVYYHEELLDEAMTFAQLIERLSIRPIKKSEERRRLKNVDAKGWLSYDEEDGTITCTVKGRKWFRALLEQQNKDTLRRHRAELRAV